MKLSSLYYHLFETDFGWVGLVASESGLRQSTLPQVSPEECIAQLSPEIDEADPDPDRFIDLANKIERFFSGERVTFDDEEIDVDDATPFHRAAYPFTKSSGQGQRGWFRISGTTPQLWTVPLMSSAKIGSSRDQRRPGCQAAPIRSR